MTATITEAPTRIDLACGQNKKDGFYGVDIAGDTDQRVDLLRFPWPWPEDTVDELHSSHFVEHIPHWRPWFPAGHDGLNLFMDECWRILKPGGTVELIHPYGLSSRALQDPSHERYIVESTWYYYNREWREQQGLDHYPILANFEPPILANGFLPEWNLRADPSREWAAAHYWNVVSDLVVRLTAIKD